MFASSDAPDQLFDLTLADVFAEGEVQVRSYPDGGARITVGDLTSTQAVLSAAEKSL
jgi:hypothetical protein